MSDIYLETGGAPYQANLYMHPGYWQPHEVGDGDAAAIQQEIPTKGECRTARDVLLDYWHKVERGGSTIPITTFPAGAEFDVAAQPPGTLMNFDVEYLYVNPGVSVDPKDYAGLDPPVRGPHYWPKTGFISARSLDSYYAQFASGTVVTQTGRREPRRAVGIHLASAIADRRLGLYRGFVYHPSEFVVGAVMHTRYRRGSPAAGIQVLSRINRVDVLVPGKTESERRKVFSLGWSALRTRHNEA